MPRDGSGNYTLPAGNPVISGTTISSAVNNTTMSDLAVAMTDSLSRTGSGGMLVPFLNADGVVALPGIAWANQPNMGFYRPGLDEMRVSVAGIDKARFTSDASNPMDIFVGAMWVAVMNEGGDYSPTGAWDFTGASSFLLPPISIVAPDAFLSLQETGGTANEGAWNLRADGDELVIASATDASPLVDVQDLFRATRTGTAIPLLNLLTELRVTDPASVNNYISISHGAGSGPGIINAVNSNTIRILPDNVAAGMISIGDVATTGVVPIGASASQNAGAQIGSTTSGHQAGWTAYVNDGVRNRRVFFGLHDNDVWGLSASSSSTVGPFVIEEAGETYLQATLNAAVELYWNNIVSFRTSDNSANRINTGAEVQDFDGIFRNAGFNEIPPETVAADITFDAADFGQMKVHDEATPRSWTINQLTNVALGGAIGITNINGTGTITIITGAGVAIEYWDGSAYVNTTGDPILGAGRFILYKRADIEYVLDGPGITI